MSKLRRRSPTVLISVSPLLHRLFFFFFNDTATTEIYTLSLHDALPIYAAIAQVAILRFTVDVKFYVALVLRNIPIELTLLCERANTAVCVTKGVVTPVEFQVSEGRHFHRRGIQPPVGQVKMVRGLVDQQRAGVLFQPVPAPEVVSAVTGIQIFVKVHGDNVANGFLH